jgi:predicted kinase
MPILYILCGLPFSGKSLLAKEIEKTTSTKRISFDDIYDTLVKSNKDVTYEAGLNEVEKNIAKNLKDSYSVVYDSSNLKKERREALKKLAEQVGATPKVVYLQVSAEEIHKRFTQSLVDKSHHYLNEEFVNKSIKRLEAPTDCISISTEEGKKNFLESLK